MKKDLLGKDGEVESLRILKEQTMKRSDQSGQSQECASVWLQDGERVWRGSF